MSLQGKNILVGVTGGIAAYKIPLLVRQLVLDGASVKVVMTPASTRFVTPETLSVVSGNEVLQDWFNPSDGKWNNHVHLGTDPDLFLIAPATANTLSAMVQGRCTNLLMGIYLSATCPVMIAPAMDHDMYRHPSTSRNLDSLSLLGHMIIQPEFGPLASGISGEGRLPEPASLAASVKKFFRKQDTLKGRRVLITSGPTIEPIDKVRFISNHSSGKMGTALAMEAAERGAQVTCVSGPARVMPLHRNVKVIPVTTAAEMMDAASAEFETTDLAIFAAAVADFAPESMAEGKIKKGSHERLSINLVQTRDILATLSMRKRPDQTVVGFAMENESEIENAQKKLVEKKLDYIVLNSLREKGAGFDTDTNKVTILSDNNKRFDSGLLPKQQIAGQILGFILNETIESEE